MGCVWVCVYNNKKISKSTWRSSLLSNRLPPSMTYRLDFTRALMLLDTMLYLGDSFLCSFLTCMTFCMIWNSLIDNIICRISKIRCCLLDRLKLCQIVMHVRDQGYIRTECRKLRYLELRESIPSATSSMHIKRYSWRWWIRIRWRCGLWGATAMIVNIHGDTTIMASKAKVHIS